MFIIYATVLVGATIFVFSLIKVIIIFKESDKVSDSEYFSIYHKKIVKYSMLCVLGVAIIKNRRILNRFLQIKRIESYELRFIRIFLIMFGIKNLGWRTLVVYCAA